MRSALQRAIHLQSKNLILRLTTDLALIADLEGAEDGERDEMVEIWRKEQEGDTSRSAAERDDVKRVGQLVRLVGVRVSEGWR